MSQEKIYYIPNVQHLVYENNNSLKQENNPMNRFDTLFFKGRNNTLDFSIRNTDRKPISLIDKTLSIDIYNVETDLLAFSKTLEKLDVTKGYARLTLTTGELLDAAPGFYSYAVSVVEENGREGYAFVDQVYRVTGQIEIRGDAVPNTINIKTIENFIEVDDTVPYYKSGAIAFGNGTIHTAAWYLTSYMGTIEVQVAMGDSVPTLDTDWAVYETFDTADLTPGSLTCIKYMNIVGNYSFVRFVYRPHTLNTGTVDRVLYN